MLIMIILKNPYKIIKMASLKKCCYVFLHILALQEMSIVFIGIGSNLGNKRANCETAIELLQKNSHIKLIARSKWYETEALTKGDPKFINGAIKLETSLSPVELLHELQKIETEIGRVRTRKKWEPRVIDLDILFYDDLVMNTPELKIPHPELHKRMFVLKPLCDIGLKMEDI